MASREDAVITVIADYDSPCVCGMKRRLVWIKGYEHEALWFHIGPGSLACIQEGA